MNRAIIMKDRRLIEALDYIDDEYIASAALYKMRAYAESTRPLAQTAGQSVKKHWKHYLGFVACLLVLALATPLFTHLPEIISSFAAGWGEGTETLKGDETTNLDAIETTDNIEMTKTNKETYSPESEELHESVITPNYLAFVSDLEPISEEVMLEIREAWTEYQYEKTYNSYYSSYIYYNDFDSEEEARLEAQKKANVAKQNARYHWFVLHLPDDGNLPKVWTYRYYGIVEDYVVLIIYNADMGPYGNSKIGDSSFEFPYGGDMLLYKNGEFFKLRSVFDEGLISNEQVAIIADRHRKYEAGYNKWLQNELEKKNKE